MFIRSFILFFVLSLPLIASPVAGENVVIVAHKNVVDTQVSSSRLLDFYAGDIKSWSDGRPVVVFDLKAKGETRDNFYHFLGKSPIRMKSIWMKKMLSGEGEPPEALETEEDVIERVASTPGAIGFVRESLVNDKVATLAVISVTSSD